MYVSLNGSLTRQMPWPDFVRLAGKVGYGGRRRQPERRQDGRRRGNARAPQRSERQAGGGELPLPVRDPDEAAFQDWTQGAAGKRAVRRRDRSEADDGSVVAGEPGAQGRAAQVHQGARDGDCRSAAEVEIRLGLEFLGPMYFRSNEKNPHTFMYTLPETARSPRSAVQTSASCSMPGTGITRGGTTAEILAAGKSRIVHVHVSEPSRRRLKRCATTSATCPAKA